MQFLIDSLTNYWYVWASAVPFILPFILSPILPSKFKSKAVMELDCEVQKAYDTITDDPRKCPVGGSSTKALEVGEQDKDGKPTEWKEEIARGEIITIKRVLGAKPGKMATIIQTMESNMADMTAKWEYVLLPAEGTGRCCITLDGKIEIRNGKWNSPLFRMTIYLTDGGKKGMIDYLNGVADASGARRKWIA